MKNIVEMFVICFYLFSCQSVFDNDFDNYIDENKDSDTSNVVIVNTDIYNIYLVDVDTDTEIVFPVDSEVIIDYEYYCEPCSEEERCPDNATCVFFEDQDGFCTGDCYFDSDCPGSMTCFRVYLFSGICVPFFENKTCEEYLIEGK